MSDYKTEVFTGLRPTGILTLGNYLGSIKQIIDLQNNAEEVLIFVADLHGLTDQEPETTSKHRLDLVADFMALGLNLNSSNIFIQSAIEKQLLFVQMLLSRHISLAELMRVPTLKDKLKDPDHPEQASVMLANYPILMAADILLQGAEYVPVGEDQMSHIEVTRLLARRFNTRYGDVFTEPKAQEQKALRIMALNGDGKMSKSKPNGAILLSESPAEASKKIKHAETAIEGEMTNALESHFNVASMLAQDDEQTQLDDLKKAHMDGEKVMGGFKALFASQVERFLTEYQQKRELIIQDQDTLKAIIEKGNRIATENADSKINKIKQVMGLNS